VVAGSYWFALMSVGAGYWFVINVLTCWFEC